MCCRVLLLIMAFMPLNKESADTSQTVDFIYSLLLFMLLTLVVLGSLAFMTLGRLDYLEALLRTLFLIGSGAAGAGWVVESALRLQRPASHVLALSAECRHTV